MSLRRAWIPLAVGLMACGKAPGGTLVQSNKARLSAASVPSADIRTQASDDTAFAFSLYHALAGTPGNLFFSPYSLSSALAMTWAGAAGDTASGMSHALHFTLPPARLHPAFNAIDQALASRAATGTSSEGGAFQLNVANALWVQKGLSIRAPFLDTLAESYGAGVRLEDFQAAPEPVRADINAWISDRTQGLIPELLGPGSITADTRLVLTNAVYFDAAWATPFPESATQPAPFHALDGSSPSVPLMHETVGTAYAHGDGWQAVELPYSNPALTLTVIVPDAGRFAEVESHLDAAFLAGVVGAEQHAQVHLGFPKVDATTHASLRGPLSGLGMDAAFSDGADFSGIDGARNLKIADVIHQATLQIDEHGTRAAAATAVTMVPTAAQPGPEVTLTVDRPFVVVLRDVPTGTVLFLGRISRP